MSDSFPICTSVRIGLAHFAAWEPYNLLDPGQVSWLGFVVLIRRSWTASGTASGTASLVDGRLGCTSWVRQGAAIAVAGLCPAQFYEDGCDFSDTALVVRQPTKWNACLLVFCFCPRYVRRWNEPKKYESDRSLSEKGINTKGRLSVCVHAYAVKTRDEKIGSKFANFSGASHYIVATSYHYLFNV